MRLNTKGTNISLTPEIQDYLEKRIEAVGKMIDLDNPTLIIDAELGRTTGHHQSGDIFKAEINIAYDGEHWRAVSEGSDLYSAIDDMRDEIVEELRSYKGRRRSLLKRGGASIKAFIKKFYR
ncbi:MAG: ribosome-associated translation inhibitor RaiA [Candidatus Taylorbacteria bacterium]|nr:ribosome-associated translation inhibitor RaiA [Candidatus Taylorbacteria bacterium]